jgi:hypothetical protein
MKPLRQSPDFGTLIRDFFCERLLNQQNVSRTPWLPTETHFGCCLSSYGNGGGGHPICWRSMTSMHRVF